MSSLQRRVARSQTKGEMIEAVKELRQAAQMWKSLYDEQTIKMAKMGEDFTVTFQEAIEEIDMTKAITYMMLYQSEDSTATVEVASIEAFNAISAEDGEWEIDIAGGDGEDFVITLLRLDDKEVDNGETPDPEGTEDEQETSKQGEQDTPYPKEAVSDEQQDEQPVSGEDDSDEG